MGQNVIGKQSAFDVLKTLVVSHKGMFTSESAKQYDFNRRFIKAFVEEYSMDEDFPGIYTMKDTFSNEIFALQYRYTKGVYSHETALML